VRVRWTTLAVVCGWAPGVWAASFTGKVLTETNAPVPSARVIVECGTGRAEALTDPAGGFRLNLPDGNNCVVSVTQNGFFPLRNRPVEPESELRLVMTPVTERVESIEVSDRAGPVDLDTISTDQRISNIDIQNVPYPTTNSLTNAMRIIPGVLPSPGGGGVHINGGGTEQSQTTLDGFNISNPLNNRFDTRLSVEAVSSVEVASGPMPAEYGKGSAGTIALNSRSGDDRFRASATNFIPGIENQKGLVIGDFTPRVNFSGPWIRGRAWWSNSVDLLYNQTVIPELQSGQDRTSSWRWSDLFHNQINLKPTNILYLNVLASYWFAPRAGLSALDPPETTADRRSRQWFVSAKDQLYLGHGALAEVGFASNRTFGREIPQGDEFLTYTPSGKRGNWFRRAEQRSGRDQFTAAGFLPAFHWKGSHVIKVGMEVDLLDYWQDIRRTGYINQRADGSPARETVFEGSGILSAANTEASLYVQDSWRVRPGFQLESGVRWDWDQLIRRVNVAPRVGFAWSPGRHENTKISGGVGSIFDATPMNLFVRPNDQFALTTYFSPDGAPLRGPALNLFLPAAAGLRSPGFFTYSLAWEQRYRAGWELKLNYLGKRGLRGLAYLNTLTDQLPPGYPNFPVQAIYRLNNARQDRYDSFEVTVRQNFGRQYGRMASYIRSSARSNNAVDLSVDEPQIVPDNTGPLPWDIPNRALSWGYLPTFWKNWALAYLVEYRTGLPFSIVGEDGSVLGAVNAHRLPVFFEANLHLEWKLPAFGYLWALRGGVNNLTARHNAVVVNNVVGGPNFLQFYGGYGRALNFRIRWLGKR